MLIKFDGIKLIYNDGQKINDRISVKISNKTALIFADGNNICSLYPQILDVKTVAEIIEEYCRDYDVEINTEETEVIAKWIKEIALANWNWYNFDVGEKLYYLDGSDSVTCISVDNVNGIIVFGKQKMEVYGGNKRMASN